MDGVQIVTELATQITRLFDDSGATKIERYAALRVAESLVPVSEVSLCQPTDSPSVTPQESS